MARRSRCFRHVQCSTAGGTSPVQHDRDDRRAMRPQTATLNCTEQPTSDRQARRLFVQSKAGKYTGLHSILDLSRPHGRLGSPGPLGLHHYTGAPYIVGRTRADGFGTCERPRAPPARRADHLAYACGMAITICNSRVWDLCIVCAVSVVTADVTGWCWLLILSRRPGNTTRSRCASVVVEGWGCVYMAVVPVSTSPYSAARPL